MEKIYYYDWYNKEMTKGYVLAEILENGRLLISERTYKNACKRTVSKPQFLTDENIIYYDKYNQLEYAWKTHDEWQKKVNGEWI